MARRGLPGQQRRRKPIDQESVGVAVLRIVVVASAVWVLSGYNGRLGMSKSAAPDEWQRGLCPDEWCDDIMETAKTHPDLFSGLVKNPEERFARDVSLLF